MIKAAINLNQDGNWLVWAGRGYQPESDFPKSSTIGQVFDDYSDKCLRVKTNEGKILRIKHGDYYED